MTYFKYSKPIYNYISNCCNVAANKSALLKSKEAQGSLGKWTCSACHRLCRVTKHVNLDKRQN